MLASLQDEHDLLIADHALAQQLQSLGGDGAALAFPFMDDEDAAAFAFGRGRRCKARGCTEDHERHRCRVYKCTHCVAHSSPIHTISMTLACRTARPMTPITALLIAQTLGQQEARLLLLQLQFRLMAVARLRFLHHLLRRLAWCYLARQMRKHFSIKQAQLLAKK